MRISDWSSDVCSSDLVGASPEEVAEAAVGAARQGVEGEVSARRIGLPVVGEGDDGAPPVGLHVAAQRGDRERPPAGDGGDGAEIETGDRTSVVSGKRV